MYLKLAYRNVRRSVRDYSVYFATLAFAACLLYSFTASTEYLLALDLTSDQRGFYESASMVMEAFSVFTVLVFAFLISYASKFILRRRSQEFGMYGLLGMPPTVMGRILAYEGCLVGVFALVCGVGLGVLLSPAFGAVAAFVFQVPWRLALVFSGKAAMWTCGCFAAIMALATWRGVRSMKKRTLGQLLEARRAPKEPRRRGLFSPALQLVAGVLILLLIYGMCLFSPVNFIMGILPLGVLAVFATGMIFRFAALRWPQWARKRPERYFRGLRFFEMRQVENQVGLSANAMACTCVLLACGMCMMVAGLAFSVGMRQPGMGAAAEALASIGFVGLFYGVTFLMAAAAVLALQQLADAADGVGRYRLLRQLGCSDGQLKGAVRGQVGVYFVAPMAFALVHAVFGFALIGFLAFVLGSAHYAVITGAVVAVTLALMAVYYVITCRESQRILLEQGADAAAV